MVMITLIRDHMKEDKHVKSFSVRLPKDLWSFLRRNSIEMELSMNQIIVVCMNNYKEKHENKNNKFDIK